MTARLLGALDRVAALFGHGTHTSAWMSEEYGPTPAAEFPELSSYSDLALVQSDRAQLLAEVRRERAARARSVSEHIETVSADGARGKAAR